MNALASSLRRTSRASTFAHVIDRNSCSSHMSLSGVLRVAACFMGTGCAAFSWRITPTRRQQPMDEAPLPHSTYGDVYRLWHDRGRINCREAMERPGSVHAG